MSNPEKPDLKAESPTETPRALTQSLDSFKRSFNRFQGSLALEPHFEDMKQDVRTLDPAQHPADIAFALESSWPKRLDQERRDALAAAHQEIAGEPDDIKKEICREKTLEVLFQDAASEDRASIQDIIKDPSSKTPEEVDAVLGNIEDLILNESVINPKGSQLEALRTTRDELHEAHKRVLETQADKIQEARQQQSAARQQKEMSTARSEVDAILGTPEAATVSEDNELEEALKKVPSTQRELYRFDNENFKGKTAEEIEDNKQLLRAFMVRQLEVIVAGQTEGVISQDTVVNIMGGGGGAVTAIKHLLENAGTRLEYNDFLKLPFSEVATSFGINVRDYVPDFGDRFRR